MKKLFLGLLSAAALFPAPALSLNWVPYTPSALGCMKLGECTEGVYPVLQSSDLETFGELTWTDDEQVEADGIIQVLNELNVDVYIAEAKYFPRGMLAVYYTDINAIYLNSDRRAVPTTIMQSLRHEGWHTVQDCMAGGIDNTFMAVIFDDDEIPQKYRHLANIRYGRSPWTAKAIPWEQGAIYAGDTADLTLDTLQACANGPLWEAIEPTPMTMEWLVKEGYL